MNIKIPAPQGSKNSLIPLCDIIRIENCSLSFFEASAYNLYIIEAADEGDECFTLFSYRQKQDMLFAYQTISTLLKDRTKEPIVLEMVPIKAGLLTG